MPRAIDAAELQVREIFSDSYHFEIPPFQRPYSWTTEEVADLYDDLIQAWGAGSAAINELPPYFLGSIVLIKDPSLPKAIVVDGQQRITTLTILFCVLRDLVTDDDIRRALHRYVHSGDKPLEGIRGHFRLSARNRDSDFFESNLQKNDSLKDFVFAPPASDMSDSQENMYENAKYLYGKLSDLDEESRQRLAAFIVQNCEMVVVSTSDHGSAYRIFAVMNDRGLSLSPTDILKAQLIGDMAESERAKYTDVWEGIEEDIGREDFRDLFSHIRMIFAKTKLRRGSLQDEFKTDVLEHPRVKGRNFIDEVLDPYADTYKTVSTAAYASSGGAEDVNDHLVALNWLTNFDWIPPAMEFLHRYPSDPQALHRFFQDLERLAYGLFVLRANINQRINRYADVLSEIEGNFDLYAEDSSLQLSPWEQDEILRGLDAPIYTIRPLRGPILRRLDSLLAEPGVKHDYSRISIEHVLPQNPGPDSHWMKSFPDEDLRGHWTHRLANLVLLSRKKNSQAQNYDFERKKNEYFQRKGVSTFALTTQVIGQSEWTAQVLERRQRDLIGVLREHWRLN